MSKALLLMLPIVFFATDKRKFIVADTPGHSEYTRNMATGASTASLAVILVDARHGMMEQTRRHTLICQLMGIRQIILAVNKMDLVHYEKTILRVFAPTITPSQQCCEQTCFEI